ncbi:MAG TPA: cytochrome c oxidase assembly protein [Gammaproteobacteria bacterium]|nr:cytochrome c oxidase assembly protein [Gammaproteobacteria bacterium]
MNEPRQPKPKHRKLAVKLLLLVVFMFGFGYALVPLYSAVCRLTGFNGRGVETVSEAYAGEADKNRQVLVQFVSTTNTRLPFEFRPDAGSMRVHPGELYSTSFYARNTSSDTVVAQAVASYAPGEAARYVHKTECFCFTRETFAPREARHMPVRFYIDPALPRDVNVVTISYTYYNVTPRQHGA